MDIEKTIKNLKARHFSVQHFASGEEACKYLLGEIKRRNRRIKDGRSARPV